MRRYFAVRAMDELLTQFLIESRELVDQVADDLLALERAPSDAARFESAFRGFHTLKGGAGIVEFAAMQTALHCAEDALASVRAEARPLSAREIGNCLRCLDEVGEWLDAIEASGAVPADADAAEIVGCSPRRRVRRPRPRPRACGSGSRR
jgi:two-component system chemotaxis sensor kinase CheA